jgi:sulfur carrier protein
MPLKVNGQELLVPDPPTLEKVLLIVRPERPYAVARNEEFVTRGNYGQCIVMDGDRIEILHPSAGG